MEGNYPTAVDGGQTLGLCGRPTISARLKGEKQDLEKRLGHVNKALELMEKNPEMAELMDALGKTYL